VPGFYPIRLGNGDRELRQGREPTCIVNDEDFLDVFQNRVELAAIALFRLAEGITEQPAPYHWRLPSRWILSCQSG
jgi:hypothetical protein